MFLTTQKLALISIICNILLCGCMNPVDIEEFLKDEQVQEIIFKSTHGEVIVDIEFEIPDFSPVLLLDGNVPLVENQTITIYKNPSLPTQPTQAHITIENLDIYDVGEIYWYCSSSNPLLPLEEDDGVSPDGTEFKADTANKKFNDAILYMVTVIGRVTENQKYYGTKFIIKVVQ